MDIESFSLKKPQITYMTKEFFFIIFMTGYMVRQPLYSCLTCAPAGSTPGGLCLACTYSCHDGCPEIAELYLSLTERLDGSIAIPSGVSRLRMWRIGSCLSRARMALSNVPTPMTASLADMRCTLMSSETEHAVPIQGIGTRLMDDDVVMTPTARQT